MKNLYRYLLLLYAAAKGSAERECTAIDETTLKCQFPENINITKKDFVVNFYPFRGGEEPVVECTWITSQLYCITQMGFGLKGAVSDEAEIAIPTKLSERNGDYKCVADGYPHNSIRPCQLPDMRGTQHFSACEVKLSSGGHQVILECIFSFNTDSFSFSVKYKTSALIKFAKSSCQNSTLCHYKVENNHHMFTMELGLPEYPYGEYLCQPYNATSLFEVKGCTVAVEKPPKKQDSTYQTLIPVCAAIVLFSGLALVLLIMKRKGCLCFGRRPTSPVSETSAMTQQVDANDVP